MNATRWMGLMLVVLCSGCMTPRSLMFGQTGQLAGAGRAEVAVGFGGSFSRATEPSTSTGTFTATTTTTRFQLPEAEANVAFGLNELADLNVHLSSAGLQPGVKVKLAEGPWSLAVMPEAAFMYSGTGGSGAAFRSLMIGAKLLAGHSSGLYAGFSYDLRYYERASTSSSSSTAQSQLSHYLAGGVGYDLKLGGVRVRPELSVGFAPIFGLQSGLDVIGTELVVLPNVTFAVGGGLTKGKP